MSKESGQEAFFFGELMALRLRLGLSKQGLADILGVSVTTLYRWEGPGMLDRLNDRNAERVDEFVNVAMDVLHEMPDFSERYITLAQAAQRLGLTSEYLLDLCRKHWVPGEDFGMLGMFVRKEHLPSVKQLIRG